MDNHQNMSGEASIQQINDEDIAQAPGVNGGEHKRFTKIQNGIVYDTAGSSLKALITQFNKGGKNDPKRHLSQNISQDDPPQSLNISTYSSRRQNAIKRQQSVEIHEEASEISLISQKQLPEIPPLMMDQFETNDKNEATDSEDKPLTSNRVGASLYVPYMLPPEEQHFTARNEKPHATQEIKDEETNPIKRAITNKINSILEFTQSAMPLIKSGVSIQADIKQGWRPKFDVTGAPIPLYYDFEPFEIPINQVTGEPHQVLYMGPRYKHSIALHQAFANKTLPNSLQSYSFKEPPNMSMINQIIKQTHNPETPREFLGMNPKLYENDDISKELIFDSNFESGNLDTVIKKKDGEYDLFMRVDTNTRGHHQWFYFSIQSNKNFMGKKVRFNVVNFTKAHSLYSHGMKVCISKKCYKYKWIKGGEDIQYKQSPYNKKDQNGVTYKQYYQLSFIYEFTELEEKTFFAYCFPYDFSKLTDCLASQKLALKAINADYCKETILCQSLGGVDVPLLTVSSRLTSDPSNYQDVLLNEFSDTYSRVSLPFYKKKKQIVICARVHPGESNASYMMQGFIKSILGQSLQAKELRKRCVFKIIPMVNPDGVIVGNYRTNMAGNDLNRKYHAPDERLHPTVCAIKKIVHNICFTDGEVEEGVVPDEDKVFAFIDMHGHSRKKNVFVYGPYYPLHNDKYLRMRVLPKLISEETSKFRFFSCKFRIERSKEKAARIVLWREFNIMNCFTFEASFYGALNDERQTEEFSISALEKMGEHLCNAFYEYLLIIEEEERIKKIKELNKKKKLASQNSARKKKKGNVTVLPAKSSTAKSTPRISEKEQINLTLGDNASFINQLEIIDEREEANTDGVMMNPNEPPESPNEQMKLENQRLMDQLRGKSQSHVGGIRSLKDMFKILKNEDGKKEREAIDEENENSSDDEKRKDSKSGNAPKEEDSGSDSDPLEGELTGKEQAALFSDIKGTIDQFETLFNTGVLKKKVKSQVQKQKQLAEQKRDVKSPLGIPVLQNEQKNTKEVSPQKKTNAKQEADSQPIAIAPIKTKGSTKKIQEQSKSQIREQYSMHQRPKVAAIVAHTNIEFFTKEQALLKIPQIQYTQVKQPNVNIGITAYSYAQQNMRATSKAPFSNPLIVSKISTEEQHLSNVVPHKMITSVFANPNNQQRHISAFNRTHMTGGVNGAASFNQALEDSLFEVNNGSFFVCGNPVYPSSNNQSVFPIAQPQIDNKQSAGIQNHIYYGSSGSMQRQQDVGSARKKQIDMDQMKQNLAKQRQHKNVSPHISSNSIVSGNQIRERQETSQPPISRQIPQPQPPYYGSNFNSQNSYMNPQQFINVNQHAKNLSDYDLTTISINETAALATGESKSKSYRPYQHMLQPVEFATVCLLNNQQASTADSAKTTQQQLFKNQPRQQSQNYLNPVQENPRNHKSPSRFEKKRGAFNNFNQRSNEENLENQTGPYQNTNDREMMHVFQMAAECCEQSDYEMIRVGGVATTGDIASGTVVLQATQSGMSQKQRQHMNMSKGKEGSIFTQNNQQKPSTPKNFKQINNSVNLTTISGHPAFQEVSAVHDLDRTQTHIFASASPNKKRVAQHMHPALLPEQQPSLYTKVGLAQHGTASGTQLPHIIQLNQDMTRGGPPSLDKKSRMSGGNNQNGNVDRYQSLQTQSQHVYMNNPNQSKGENFFKMNTTAYKQSYPGKNVQQYEELLPPEAATGVSIGQNSTGKRRNSRGNPSLHNSGKTVAESTNYGLHRTESKKKSSKFQAIVDQLVQEHLDVYNIKTQQHQSHL